MQEERVDSAPNKDRDGDREKRYKDHRTARERSGREDGYIYIQKSTQVYVLCVREDLFLATVGALNPHDGLL